MSNLEVSVSAGMLADDSFDRRRAWIVGGERERLDTLVCAVRVDGADRMFPHLDAKIVIVRLRLLKISRVRTRDEVSREGHGHSRSKILVVFRECFPVDVLPSSRVLPYGEVSSYRLIEVHLTACKKMLKVCLYPEISISVSISPEISR